MTVVDAHKYHSHWQTWLIGAMLALVSSMILLSHYLDPKGGYVQLHADNCCGTICNKPGVHCGLSSCPHGK